MTMQRFNIALLPIDAMFQYVFEQVAVTHFQNIADRYLLGAEALAHVTLCQFYAENTQVAVSAFYAWNMKKDIDLQLGSFNLRKGTAEHSGHYFAEFLIQPTAELIDRQAQCVDHLHHLGFETLTPTTTYAPHITLARLREPPAANLSLDLAYKGPIQHQMAVGASSETGVFMQRLSLS